jgi:hypothetical protein
VSEKCHLNALKRWVIKDYDTIFTRLSTDKKENIVRKKESNCEKNRRVCREDGAIHF